MLQWFSLVNFIGLWLTFILRITIGRTNLFLHSAWFWSLLSNCVRFYFFIFAIISWYNMALILWKCLRQIIINMLNYFFLTHWFGGDRTLYLFYLTWQRALFKVLWGITLSIWLFHGSNLGIRYLGITVITSYITSLLFTLLFSLLVLKIIIFLKLLLQSKGWCWGWFKVPWGVS